MVHNTDLDNIEKSRDKSVDYSVSESFTLWGKCIVILRGCYNFLLTTDR